VTNYQNQIKGDIKLAENVAPGTPGPNTAGGGGDSLLNAAKDHEADTPDTDEQDKSLADSRREEAEREIKAKDADVWYAALPEKTHEAFGKFKDVDELAERLKAMEGLTHVTKPEDYKFKWEGAVDPDIAAGYAEFCCNRGIAQEQAQGLIDFQRDMMAQYQAKMKDEGEGRPLKLNGV
jgi:hypothetical protein